MRGGLREPDTQDLVQGAPAAISAADGGAGNMAAGGGGSTAAAGSSAAGQRGKASSGTCPCAMMRNTE